MGYRRYTQVVTVNGVRFIEVLIDPHYEEKHAGSITDEIILKLVMLLDHEDYKPDDVDNGFCYFVTLLELSGKCYRFIWLIPDDLSYLGVRNAFRSSD